MRAFLDTSAFTREIFGWIEGAVEEPTTMGGAGNTYPYFRWTDRLNAIRRSSSGELEFEPVSDLQFVAASGVHFEAEKHALGVGLNDLEAFGLGSSDAETGGDLGPETNAS